MRFFQFLPALLKHSLALTLTLAFHTSPSLAQGNGGDRGGGDEIVAEFRDVEQSVIHSLEAWVNDRSIQSDETLKNFLAQANKIQIFSLESFRADAQPESPGFWIEPLAVPPRLTLLRSEWRRLKTTLSRVELETLVFEKLLRTLKLDSAQWPKTYSDNASKLGEWKEEKAIALQVALNTYADASKFLQSNPYLVYEAALKTLFLHSDFERCTARGNYQKIRQHAQLEGCGRWFKIFWEKVESNLPSAPAQTNADTTHSSSPWLASKVKAFLDASHTALDHTLNPFRGFRTAFDQTCTDVSPVAQALCLETLRETKHKESKTALTAAETEVENALNTLSDQLARQVSAP